MTRAQLDVSPPPQAIVMTAVAERRDVEPISAPPFAAHVESGDPGPLDEDAIRADIVEFLDQAEARARRRPDWASGLAREQLRQQRYAVEELAETTERFSLEFERERDASRREVSSRLEQAEAAAEQRIREARVEVGRLLDSARTDARELVRRAQGEAEQTLEWSRAQGAEIVRRSQRVAAERFTHDPRPWFAPEPGPR